MNYIPFIQYILIPIMVVMVGFLIWAWHQGEKNEK